jgi:hypothetical protein
LGEVSQIPLVPDADALTGGLYRAYPDFRLGQFAHPMVDHDRCEIVGTEPIAPHLRLSRKRSSGYHDRQDRVTLELRSSAISRFRLCEYRKTSIVGLTDNGHF